MEHIKKSLPGHAVSAMVKSAIQPVLGRRGTVAILVAMIAPILISAMALGIEVSGWTVIQQRLQRAADAAALAAAEAYSRGATAQTAATYGAYVAEINHGLGAATRTWTTSTQTLSDNMVTIEMIAGVKSSADPAFAASIKTTVPLSFSALVLKGPTQSLSAAATAELIPSQTGKYCILTLDPSAATGVSTAGMDLSNGATLDLSQCGVQVNSTGVDALYLTGGANLTATSVSLSGSDSCTQGSSSGTYSCGNGASMTVSGSVTTGTAQLANPYANVSIPTPGSCPNSEPTTISSSQTISSGTFCGGLTISNGAQVTMNPGVYIINNGNFDLGGGSLTGKGVTIVLASSSGSNYGTATINNGTTVNLTAPTTGATAGIAIIQSPLAPATPSSGTPNSFAGGTNFNITGALIFPTQVVNFSNGSSNTSSCTQLIAYQVQFTGGSKFGNNCSGTGTSAIGPSYSTSLVE